MAKYASKLRPISLGCYPKYNDNKVVKIENFDDRKIYKHVLCWGYVEYENEIPEVDALQYDLVLLKVYKSQMRASTKYSAENYDKILFRTKKGQRELIKEKADSLGMSVNEFILSAVMEKIDKM